jgi:DNA-binding Lrp family transcriptional regulator
MDTIDRKILSLINNTLPIAERPFQIVAQSVGISEEETIDRIKKLKAERIIRRIGAVINPRGIGWQSTLCAVDVPMERLEEFAVLVGRYEEVTHNYLRDGQPNCWFTLIAPSKERISEIIREIEQTLDIKILDLPANKVFKIRVALDIS